MLKPIILLLQIICYCNTLNSESEKEQTYSDVLKNITFANEILQDLIKNYEWLEKNYQSEELLQIHSTSTEIDQTFKSLSVNKPKMEQRNRSDRKYTRKPFMGTAMIYDSSSNEKVTDESNEETQEVKNNRRPAQLNRNNFKDKKLSNEDLNTRFKIVNGRSKITKREPNTNVDESEAKSKESSEGEDSEEVEQIIIDIPEEVSGVVFNTPNERLIKSDSGDKPITNIWGTKTRFSIQHTASRKGKPNLSRDESQMSRVALRSRNKSRGIERIIRSEIITTNKIKKNMSTNKPAKIRKHVKELSQMKNNTKSKNKDKITLLILTNNNKANHDWNQQFNETKIKNKQVFPNTDSQNDTLRSGYGDTCLQMPIKKCKKALRNVNKNICKRRFKCKSDFKSDFIEHSKDGCNEEFAYREKSVENETKGENNEKFSPLEFRELKKKSLKYDRKNKKSSVKVLPKKEIKFNVVDNNDPQKGLYEKMYFAKNVEHSEINRKFSEIIRAINSTRKHSNNGQEIKLAGAIIILRRVQNYKQRAHSYVTENSSKKCKEQQNICYFRNPYRKIVLVIPDNKNGSFMRERLSIEDSKDSKAKPKNKEIVHLKSNILRDKYADACIKVAVRKCYKALIAVNKNVCKVRYRCKSSFKSHFKNKSKVACIEEFDYTKRYNSTNNKTMLKKKRASGKGDKMFVDATREGYLDACIPYMVPNYKLKNKVAHKSMVLRNDTLARKFAEVLRRSRSERKCQRLSRQKCVQACYFAARETCAEYDCSRKWEKAFGKVCKEECRRAYQVQSSSDSSDTSGSY